MSIYRCYDCEKMVDNDHHPCAEHPTLSTELLCPDCVERQQPARKPIVFTQAQLDEIKKLEADAPEWDDIPW